MKAKEREKKTRGKERVELNEFEFCGVFRCILRSLFVVTVP